MRLQFIFLAFAISAGVVAIPQESGRFTNTTSSSSSALTSTSVSPSTSKSSSGTRGTITASATLPSGSCAANCTVGQYPFPEYYWVGLSVNTTITAATLIYVVNNRTNTTRTITSYNKLPSGYTLPPTNSLGTQIAVLTVPSLYGQPSGGSITTTLAWPTPYVNWPYGYSFEGTLSTTSSNGQGSCLIATSTYALHFYNYTYTSPTSSIAFITYSDVGTILPWTNNYHPTQESGPFTVGNGTLPASDDFGYFYTLATESPCNYPLGQTEGVGAFSGTVCQRFSCALPAAALNTASFLTDTSTSFEAAADVTSPEPSPTPLGPPPQTTSAGNPQVSPTASQQPASSSPPPSAQPQVSSPDLGALLSSIAASPTPSPAPLSPPVSNPQVSTPPASTSPASNPPASNPPASNPPASTSVVPDQASSPAASGQPAQSSPPQPSTQPGFSATPQASNPAPGSPVSSDQMPPSVATTVIPAVISGISTQVPAVVVGSQTQALSSVNIPTTISGSSTNVPAVVVGSQTVPIGQTATINNVPVAITQSGSNVVIVPSPSPAAPSQATPAAVTFNGQTITANSNSAFVIGSQTLAPIVGSSITVGSGPSATVIAVATNGAGQTQIVGVQGSSTAIIGAPSPAPSATGSATPPALTVNGQAIAPSGTGSVYVISGQTLAPSVGSSITIGTGSSATTIGVTINGQGQTQLVVAGQSTTQVAPFMQASATAGSPPVLTFNGQTITPSGTGSVLVVSGQTLVPSVGSSITIGSGSTATTIGVTTNAQGQTQIVIAGQSTTQTAPYVSASITGSANVATITSPPALTIGGQTFSALSGTSSVYVISGQTLSIGGSVSITSGSSAIGVTLTTNAQGSTVLVVGTSTSNLPSATVVTTTRPGGTTSSGLGGLIISGLGGPGSGTATQTGTTAGARSSAAAVPTAAAKGVVKVVVAVVGVAYAVLV